MRFGCGRRHDSPSQRATQVPHNGLIVATILARDDFDFYLASALVSYVNKGKADECHSIRKDFTN